MTPRNGTGMGKFPRTPSFVQNSVWTLLPARGGVRFRYRVYGMVLMELRSSCRVLRKGTCVAFPLHTLQANNPPDE